MKSIGSSLFSSELVIVETNQTTTTVLRSNRYSKQVETLQAHSLLFDIPISNVPKRASVEFRTISDFWSLKVI
jgi:hypothetical protein